MPGPAGCGLLGVEPSGDAPLLREVRSPTPRLEIPASPGRALASGTFISFPTTGRVELSMPGVLFVGHLPFKIVSLDCDQSGTSYSPPSYPSFTLHGALVVITFMPFSCSPTLIWKLSKKTIDPSTEVGLLPPYSAGMTGSGGGNGFSTLGGGGGLGILRTGSGGLKNALRPSKRSRSTLANCSCFFSEFSSAADGSTSPPNVSNAKSRLAAPLKANAPEITTNVSATARRGVQ